MAKRPFNVPSTRRVRRRMSRMTVPRPVRKTNELSMRKCAFQSTWAFGTATTNDFWRYLTWTPSSAIQNFAEIQALFDEYKINAIKITFRPRFTEVSADGAAAHPQGYLHYCIDPASTVSPTGTYSAATVNAFLENDNVVTKPLNEPIEIYFRPKVADQLFGGTTSTRQLTPTWMKTNNNAVDFRGVHALIQLNNFSTSAPNMIIDQFVTVYMQVRNLR